MVRIFFFLLISAILVVTAEFGLWVIWNITKSPRLDTIYGNQISQSDQKEKLQFNLYVDNPEDYLKIAIFGGSAAMGATAERNFANVLDYDLKRLVGPNIFVKNYALPGDTFHKEQAEILKNVIPHYDIFIIYAGNNEWANLYYENCGVYILNIEIPNCKKKQQMRNVLVNIASHEIHNKFNFFKLLEKKSRIYAMSLRIKYKLVGIYKNYIPKNSKSKKGGSVFSKGGVKRPNQSEKNKAFSTDQISKIPHKFQSDLLEIARLAKKKNKLVIVIGAVGNELWPPYFSKHPEEMSKSDVKFLNYKLNEVKKYLKNKNFTDAQNQISEILKISPKHAYANYLMGNIFKALGNWDKSWNFFKKSVDEDGFPHRALSKINILSKKITENFQDNLVYVDYPLIVRQLISSGYSPRKLYSDWIHPTTLGHIIIGRSAICKISKFQEFKSNKTEDFCKIPNIKDLEPLYNSYKSSLKISLLDTIRSKKPVYRWAVLNSRITSHPEIYYKIAEEYLYFVYPNFETNQNDKVSILVLSAFFQAKQGEQCENLKVLLDQALSISPSKFYDLLDKPFPFPEEQLNIKKSFKEVGLNLNVSIPSQVTCSI